jgi:hypothetical protein
MLTEPEKLDPLSRLPGGRTPFEITDNLLQGLDEFDRAKVHEEWFYRNSFIRAAMRCTNKPIHDFKLCSKCVGKGVRTDPRSGMVKCSPCDGTGMVFEPPPMTWGCKHVYPQDEVNPVGLIFMPKRFYVCGDCRKLIERRKFKYATEVVGRCWNCIQEESWRIHKINPELVLDLNKKEG